MFWLPAQALKYTVCPRALCSMALHAGVDFGPAKGVASAARQQRQGTGGGE